MKESFETFPGEEKDVGMRLLHDHETSSLDSSDDSIGDLLTRAALDDGPVRAIISAGTEDFILYATRVDEAANFSLADAVQCLTRFVSANNSSSISVFYRVGKADGQDDQTCLATLNRAQGDFADSLSWSRVTVTNADLGRGKARRFIESWLKRAARWKTTRLRTVALLFTVALAGLTLTMVKHGVFQTPFHQYYENGVWVRYDTTMSEGPKYQLQFSRHNVSDWVNPYPEGAYAVRIDDQAIIPAHLMDEDERKYQRWFRQRYPAMRDVVDNKDFLSKDFLSDPDRLKVDADWLFHPAHCILALRRYWKAKESGHHVCPRDIDYRHIHHCLDSLDEWFFIGGEMRKAPPDPVDYEAKWSLVWKTKVCW